MIEGKAAPPNKKAWKRPELKKIGTIHSVRAGPGSIPDGTIDNS